MDDYITIGAIADPGSYLLGIFNIDGDIIAQGGETGQYSFFMPNQDVQYLAKFRPNPVIKIISKWSDENGQYTGDSTPGAGDSKGVFKIYESEYIDLGDDDDGSEDEYDDDGNDGDYD